jgi:AAT family amino acid transporter
MKEMGFTVTALYAFPILLLSLIYPWQQAADSKNIFADALNFYGFSSIANIFTILVIIGVLTCINSGMYASSRTMQALAELKMAPSLFVKIDDKGVPRTAMLFNISIIWLIFLASYFFPSRDVYAYLVVLSGFVGMISWVSICWSQLRHRRTLSIWVQVGAMCLIALNKELRMSFYAGIIFLIIPIAIYKCKKRFFSPTS